MELGMVVVATNREGDSEGSGESLKRGRTVLIGVDRNEPQRSQVLNISARDGSIVSRTVGAVEHSCRTFVTQV